MILRESRVPSVDAERAQARVLEARGVAAQRLDGEQRLAASLDLGAREVAHVGAVVAGHHDHVERRRLAGVGDAAPRPADAADLLRDEALAARPVERLLEVGAEEVVLLALRLDAPALAPVAVGGSALRDVVEKARLVDARAGEHDGDAHHRAARVSVAGRPRAERHVGVAGGVHDALRPDRPAARLALGDDSLHQPVLDDGLRDEAVEERLDAGLLDQPVGDDLEELGVQRLAAGLDVRRRAAHLFGAALELDADALEVDGRLRAGTRRCVSTPTWVMTPPKQP